MLSNIVANLPDSLTNISGNTIGVTCDMRTPTDNCIIRIKFSSNQPALIMRPLLPLRLAIRTGDKLLIGLTSG